MLPLTEKDILLGFLDSIPMPHPANIKQFSDTSRASKNSTPFWHYLSRDSIRFYRLRVVLKDCPSLPTSDASCKPQAVTCASQPTGYWLEVPVTSSLGQINLLEGLTEFRETFIFSSLLKDMTKDTNQLLDEEIHRARSQTRVHLSLWSPGPSLMVHGSVLVPPSMGALQKRTSKVLSWVFYGSFINSHDWVSHWP